MMASANSAVAAASTLSAHPFLVPSEHGSPSLFGAGLSSRFCLTQAARGAARTGELLRQAHYFAPMLSGDPRRLAGRHDSPIGFPARWAGG
jgi:hypothetical protein